MTDQLVLGVALAIPQPHATILTNWRRQVGDPAADLIWPHVTLLPPTQVPAGAMDEIEAHLTVAARATGSFEMHLAGTGTFRPASPVVFVQVARGVADCERLEAAVRTGPLARGLEFPYHPHVTIAQEIDDAGLDQAYDGLAGFTARFPVTHFVLFSRDGQRRWKWRTEFALGAAAG
ncbi:MAG: 2'-5' RNA ligase family protein [Jatrophihabitantaceae bacterium]